MATIEIRNEARVHLWYGERFGKAISPFTGARDAVDSLAATACCVALTRDGHAIDLYAPFGLDDTIAMHLRPNRHLAPRVLRRSARPAGQPAAPDEVIALAPFLECSPLHRAEDALPRS